MAFDYKKEYKEFYLPLKRPQIVEVPEMNYIAVRGTGDPNVEGGEYKASIGLLYALAFTIKMSYRGDRQIKGYFQYVMPPLEGFWWQEGVEGFDYNRKETFQWISVIRLPDFVKKEDLEWATEEVRKKKGLETSKAEFLTVSEGLCVQIMHIGPYDDEPASIQKMDDYIKEQGYVNDLTDTRRHHEIYLSDARKVQPERWRTVIRHPIRKG